MLLQQPRLCGLSARARSRVTVRKIPVQFFKNLLCCIEMSFLHRPSLLCVGSVKWDLEMLFLFPGFPNLNHQKLISIQGNGAQPNAPSKLSFVVILFGFMVRAVSW